MQKEVTRCITNNCKIAVLHKSVLMQIFYFLCGFNDGCYLTRIITLMNAAQEELSYLLDAILGTSSTNERSTTAKS